MALYGISINAPYQAGQDFKERYMVRLIPCEVNGVLTSWTLKDDRQYATEDKETAEQIAGFYAESWDAEVVPVTEGRELTEAETDTALDVLQREAVERKKVERQLARVR